VATVTGRVCSGPYSGEETTPQEDEPLLLRYGGTVSEKDRRAFGNRELEAGVENPMDLLL